MKERLNKLQLVEIIKKVKVFEQFEDAALLELVELSEIENFAQEEVIIPEGVENDKIYLIIHGEVDVFADGGYILTLRRQGDLIGEMSVISKNPTTAEVRARTEISLFSISDSLIRSRGSVELVLLLNKICLDILTYKLTKTTDKAKDFDSAYHNLTTTQAELAESQGDLKVSTGILNSVLESMSDGVVVTDENGFVLLHNHAFSEIMGIEEVPKDVNSWPQDLGLYEQDETTLLGLDSTPLNRIKQSEKENFQDIFVKNAGKPEGFWIQAGSNALDLDLISEEHGAVTVIRDITAKRLERDALIKAKEEAENAAKAKTNFLSVMSHELRTPLNAILGMSQLLEKSGLNEEQEDLLHSLKGGGEALFRMISNILDLSQFEAGTKLGFFKEKISLKHIAEQLEENFTKMAKHKNLTFEVDFGALLPLDIATDKVKFLQVIGNLVENSIKFSTSGKVSVSLSLDKEDVIFKISDQGIGIDEAMRETLFEAFSQNDNSFAREYEGLGIGLALCRHLALLLGGKIWLNSVVGQGTEVFLSFPKKAIELGQAGEKDAAKPEKKHLISPDFAKEYPMKILLAEDNLTNQKLAVKVLRKLGFEVAVANNGLEACQAMEAVDYDVILMDLQMPEMDGVEAAKKILGEMKKPVKIIALTANAAAGVREECEAVGMVGFLNKPMNIMELTRNLALHCPPSS